MTSLQSPLSEVLIHGDVEVFSAEDGSVKFYFIIRL